MWWQYQFCLIVQFFQFCGLKQEKFNYTTLQKELILGQEARSCTYPLTIVLYLLGHVIVHYMLDSWEIQTFGGNICRN